MAQMRAKEEYIYGSAALRKELAQRETRSVAENHAVRRNREKAVGMNLASVFMMVLAIGISAFVLIAYLNLQSQVTASINHVSKMESELYTLRQENDEFETRIKGSIDLNQIKRIAITELGMNYAEDGQIVTVEAGSDDYVRKFSDIP